MASNSEKIDLLLQYILAVAGREEGLDRKLGPIHLIKYVYLADLEYARHHGGQSYTGLPWRFYHYGPWAPECFQRIEPALSAIGAEKSIIESSKYDQDVVRWATRDDALFDHLGQLLDLAVAGAVQKYVRMFGSDTTGLLHFVYRTAPMLKARPNDYLDFSIDLFPPKQAESELSPKKLLTPREIKKRKQHIVTLRERISRQLDAEVARKRGSGYPVPPRYDDTFFQGLAQLDAMGSYGLEPGEYPVEFSADVWKSNARHDPDIP